MTTQESWDTEKVKILNMALADKRKLYKSSEYVTLEDVDTWPKYAKKHSISDKQINSDDIAELKKVTLNSDLNKTLADKVSIFQGDITKLEVSTFIL